MKTAPPRNRLLRALVLNSVVAALIAFVIYIIITVLTGGGLGGDTLSSGLVIGLVTLAVSFLIGGAFALFAARRDG